MVPIGESLNIDLTWDGFDDHDIIKNSNSKMKMELNKIQILEYQRNEPPYLMIIMLPK